MLSGKQNENGAWQQGSHAVSRVAPAAVLLETVNNLFGNPRPVVFAGGMGKNAR